MRNTTIARCPECDGRGYFQELPSNKTVTCERCEGVGRVVMLLTEFFKKK